MHSASFPLRTWVAFVLAGSVAGTLMNAIILGLSYGGAQGARIVGGTAVQDDEDLQQWILLAIQLYLFPQVYSAVAASRDEAMYRSIVATSRERAKRRLVVVVGAAHANGILARVRTRGL